MALDLGGTSLGTVTTDVLGGARVSVRIPTDTPLGAATISVRSSDGSLVAEQVVTVRS